MKLNPQDNPKHFICFRCGNTLTQSCPMRKDQPCSTREYHQSKEKESIT